MYGCEIWTIKKTVCSRIDAFELWCWRRLLRVPWTARRSNQPILNEISPEYLLEGLMLKLKLQYFGNNLMWRTGSLEKTLMMRKIEGRKRRGRPRMRWLSASPTGWTSVWESSRSWWWTGRAGVLQSLGSQECDRNEWLNWTELRQEMVMNFILQYFLLFLHNLFKIFLFRFLESDILGLLFCFPVESACRGIQMGRYSH